MPRLRLLTAAAAMAAVLGLAWVGNAAIEDDVFTSATWRVRVELPTNWQPTEQAAYPNVLLWLERRDPRGVILFAAERVAPKLTVAAYAEATSKLLSDLGFDVRPAQLHTTTGAYLVDFQNGTAFLRQAFLIKNGIGYTLTLSAPSSRLRGLHLRPFDTMLRRIVPLRRAVTGDDPAPEASTNAQDPKQDP